MSQQDTKELRVGPYEQTKRVMYLIKELLLNNTTIDVVSGTAGAVTVASATEALVRLGYVTYSAIRTETNIINGGRRTKFLVELKKTNNFQKLYDENEAVRKQKEQERQGSQSQGQSSQGRSGAQIHRGLSADRA